MSTVDFKMVKTSYTYLETARVPHVICHKEFWLVYIFLCYLLLCTDHPEPKETKDP